MSNKIFCSQCGAEAQVDQKFCEQCGNKLTSTSPETINDKIGRGQSVKKPISEGLFAQNRNFYTIKEKFWDWGSGPIYDKSGNEIGKMNRKLLSIRAKIEFEEMDGRVVGSINKKLIAIRPTYTLHDEMDNTIGRFQKTLLSIIKPKFYLKDPISGKILFTALGKFMGFDFNIYRGKELTESNVIGEIHKADRWRDVFLGGAFDFKDTYGLKILDPDVDRRLILGFVIAIDNVLHDK